ncbi:5-formyltetrahydrofolate cyclo-ligase [Bacillus fonticola]|uniref:5-formyltetrahydrofolate cyclo-ligase n=1 Tax=Bacillus fonticola TaxID=2728853 RepID=UPI00147603DC|nr:5-formyltetrahydrofolate cyclo-ligase [Bacillus fonticola]
MDKEAIRRQVWTRLKAIPAEERLQKTAAVHQALFTSSFWNISHTVAVTVSTPREIDTIHIIKQAWKENKCVVVPKCFPDTRTMRFFVLEQFDQLEVVYSGLKEPKVNETEEYPIEHIDLLIVPGVAFTKAGERLGVGGGYYDRLLAAHSEMTTIALCLQEQLFTSLPMEPHDQFVQHVLSD